MLKSENKPLYTAIISKEIDCTYAHTLNVLAELEKLKLVSFKETGRIKLVNLTELGEEAAAVLENFIDLLRLGDAEAEVNQIYEREIKGRLRAEMNKKAMRLEDDGVGEIKKQRVIMAALSPKVRVFIGRNRTVTSRRRAGDNRAIFGGDQTKQVKTSW
ncbi:unnamed protein product [marine sediment metagenome]|uniref:HTH marR-type domain-containing protein n=1 Tax=marine sediment metagenome TaxID=412755 RepID=X1CG37_9ZZZZ